MKRRRLNGSSIAFYSGLALSSLWTARKTPMRSPAAIVAPSMRHRSRSFAAMTFGARIVSGVWTCVQTMRGSATARKRHPVAMRPACRPAFVPAGPAVGCPMAVREQALPAAAPDLCGIARLRARRAGQAMLWIRRFVGAAILRKYQQAASPVARKTAGRLVLALVAEPVRLAALAADWREPAIAAGSRNMSAGTRNKAAFAGLPPEPGPEKLAGAVPVRQCHEDPQTKTGRQCESFCS